MNYLLTYALYILILSVLMGVSTWKLFKKLGYSPLVAFVPFYNYFIVLKETKHPKWWVVLAYFPIVGTIMMTIFHLFLMKKFGRDSIGQKLLTIVFPFIYMAVVNYSSDVRVIKDYDEDDRKETVLGSLTYAVVFATLVHTFSFQPFGIPTGSMERTLLVGDFLFVNKLSYGYRMPMRPLALPFLQGTIWDTGEKGNPKDDPKSYVEAVKLPYWRLPGWDSVQRNDIVVFNYPDDSVHVSIDRKDSYVKRAVAVAGDVLEIKGGKLFINGKPEEVMGDAEMQQSYDVAASSPLDIPSLYKYLGFLPVVERGQNSKGEYIYYFSGLTSQLVEEIKQIPEVISVTPKIQEKGVKDVAHYLNLEASKREGVYVESKKINYSSSIFPFNKDWNKDWYGPLRIPKKGDVITLTQENLPEYRTLITKYEGNILEYKGGAVYINGEKTDKYTVKQDYYFMMGDNRDASLDSRYFGFVPETHIVGKPMFTWMSIEGLFGNDQSHYQANGKKLRFDRMFKATNTGEADKASYWWLAVILLTLFFGWEYFVKFFKKKKEED